MKRFKVGLAVGRGTGAELAEVFDDTAGRFAHLNGLELELVRSPRVYESYLSMPEGDIDWIVRHTDEDATHYQGFCEELAGAGVGVIFRTAFNAQTLYLVRQRLQAVKVDHLMNDTVSLVLVRDQLQGFYTGDNSHGPGEVTRTERFSMQDTERVLAFALSRARAYWGDDPIDRVTMVYKFHLLDGALSAWARELSVKYGVKLIVCQPDTANRNIINDGLAGRVLMIGSNEWADIMHAMLLDRLGLGRQEGRFSENTYLRPDLNGLVEYQTVHGSADDIAGKGVVNPLATMRAAAAIVEEHGGAEGAVRALERALEAIDLEQIATPDSGGACSTAEVVEAALNELDREVDGSATSFRGSFTRLPQPDAVQADFVGRRAALLVMDFQNDFCTSEGIGAEYRGDMNRMTAPAQNISSTVDFARDNGLEVIFVQFLGDEKYQSASWRRRDKELGKRAKCIEGTWGADFHGMSPQPGERVFAKHAAFDAFLSEGFEEYVSEQGIEHLIMAGVYSDVCLDSTARTAFQKGYFITVLSDCTTGLHLRDADVMRFMKRLYGAQVVSHDEFAASYEAQLNAR